MSRLLTTVDPGTSPAPVGSAAWTIAGMEYDNSAVKFWSGLLDEVAEDFPGANGLTLLGVCDDLLAPAMLDPAGLFEDELNAMEDEDAIDGTMEELAQELEIIGPPSAVKATVLDGARTLCTRDLPEDVIDAELLPIFLVWPLEWARLSEFVWNHRQVNGRFSARDNARGLTYEVRFSLDNQHIREGLFIRQISVWFTRQAAVAV